MTRKDYELVAYVLRHKVETLVAREYLANTFAKAFADENANFNRDKFLRAVHGKKGAADAAAT